jgi:hypothetical protein
MELFCVRRSCSALLVVFRVTGTQRPICSPLLPTTFMSCSLLTFSMPPDCDFIEPPAAALCCMPPFSEG